MSPDRSTRTSDERPRDHRARSLAVAALTLFAVTLSPERLRAQENCGGFTPGLFWANGTNGAIRALATWDDGTGAALFVGGDFTFAGRASADHVARWDGREWRTLGGGIDGPVHALTVFDDGTGAALYAGGSFSRAGGVPATNIAKWDGGAWSPVGEGTNRAVRAFTIWDDGRGPALFVGGEFDRAGSGTARRLARWDGAGWSAVGTGVAGTGASDVRALVPHDDGSGPSLFVGGSFERAGGMTIVNVARWDGAAFHPLVNGLTHAVDALAVWNDGNGDALYLGGEFQGIPPGGLFAGGIARWDGSRYWPLATGLYSGGVKAFHVHDDGSGPRLFAGGDFMAVRNLGDETSVAAWNGTSWDTLVRSGAHRNRGATFALAAFDDGTGSRLFAGGRLILVGGLDADGIASWDGSLWQSFGRGGVNGPVRAMTPFDDGSGSALYAAGSFTSTEGRDASRIARWSGRDWSDLGGGLDDTVHALAVHDDGAGSALYAGGDFTLAGTTPANRVARWDGTEWTALGNGLPAQVRALAVFDDGTGPALYAGGNFYDTATSMRGLARWDGSDWQQVGGGVNGRVDSLSVFDDGSRRLLVVAGDFSMAGAVPASNIATWDGASWTALGSGLGSRVYAVAPFDDGTGPVIYAGGYFFRTGEDRVGCIARWDGSSWQSVGEGFVDPVYALATGVDSDGPALFVGGDFTRSGSIPLERIAKWNGASFAPLGAGMNETVFALSSSAEFDEFAVYVGGEFRRAGDQAASRIARWAEPCAESRAGSVNLGRGPRTDVLFVNDTAGGPARRLALATYQPLTIYMSSPPAAPGGAPFALYLWMGEPGAADRRALPYGIGSSCMPTPLSSGPPWPLIVWNNTGKRLLGESPRPSAPAPTIVLTLPVGTGRAATFVLQGLIADPGSKGSRPASVTNAVTVEIR